MASSFFSKKSPVGKEIGEEPPSLLAVVRTMEEDLDDAKNGRPEPVAVPVERQAVKNAVSQKAVNPFSEEGEEILRVQTRKEGEQLGGPFGVPISKNGLVPKVPAQPSLKNGLSGLVPDGQMLTNRAKKSRKVFWVSASAVLVLALAAGGAFYFFSQQKQAEPPVSLSTLESASSPEETPAESTPKEPTFALDKPNYLSFNTETVSPEDIKKVLTTTALRIQEVRITQPVEFLVTDQNNNPLAFSRFAFLLKLDPAADVLALTDEAFSLYAYDDAGRVRFGLALTFKDAAAAGSAIAKVETTLPYAFQALIFEPDTNVAKTLSFRSSTYNEFVIRFANISSEKNVSLDYTLHGNQWLIGTSKNTLRAIVDKQTQ